MLPASAFTTLQNRVLAREGRSDYVVRDEEAEVLSDCQSVLLAVCTYDGADEIRYCLKA
jgi:hypothetical protein